MRMRIYTWPKIFTQSTSAELEKKTKHTCSSCLTLAVGMGLSD